MLMFNRRNFITAALSAAAMAFGMPAAADDDWPNRAIQMYVPSAAGGGADTVARLIGKHISEQAGQPVVVENRPGGSGVIGANALLNAPKDGYTFMLGFTLMSQFPATTTTELPYDVEEDFIPVSLVARSSNVWVVNPNLADVDTVDELVELLKAEPDAHSYGSYGYGSTGQFLGEQFKLVTDTSAEHIPYKGAAPMMTDVLGGVVSFAFPDIGSALPHLDSDRVRVLAVSGTGGERMPTLPDAPTAEELGYDDFDFGGWFGVFAAKDTPAEAVERMEQLVQDAVNDPEIQKRLTGLNLVPVGSDTETFREFFANDIQLWSELAEKNNITMD
ncbi:MAG TPA: tripartite tricarboxylate transporter substrate binding protein [Paenalcaligenes sp.]|nr:tripartite tricarboxylate transporter substrate binding protein [Paenalcaligenes sp.]